jgi:hypothetical protein
MNFAEKVISFHENLQPDWEIPEDIELIFPFGSEETMTLFKSFYQTYFADTNDRSFIFGINPGRFGAGITGVPFTDPVILEKVCGISNDLNKRHELSSIFVYDIINAFGGPSSFYSRFYITSVCPLGFISKGKNVNYYDDKALYQAVKGHIVENIRTQLNFGHHSSRVFSLGKGKNYDFMKRLNDEFGFFQDIVPLPHPRWVMQYRLKRKEEFIDEIVEKLQSTQ